MPESFPVLGKNLGASSQKRSPRVFRIFDPKANVKFTSRVQEIECIQLIFRLKKSAVMTVLIPRMAGAERVFGNKGLSHKEYPV
jgi:hypothetical protein